MSTILICERTDSRIDGVESLVEEIRNGGFRVLDQGVEKVFVEVLTTPFGCVFTGMTAEQRRMGKEKGGGGTKR